MDSLTPSFLIHVRAWLSSPVLMHRPGCSLRLHHPGPPRGVAGIADAWKRNLATGGIGQAVRVVEDTAVLGTQHLLEFDTTRPFLERLLLSELGLGLSVGLAFGLALSLGCSCLARRCRRAATSAGSS